MIEVQKDGPLGTIVLNRPEQLNALAGTMREDLRAAIAELRKDPQTRILLVTGAGRGFCSGGDLGRLRELREAGASAELGHLLELGADVVLSIRSCPKPVIASINGATAGAGLALALACDLRIAAESASFSAAFVRIGLVPDWGSTYLLTRIAGPAAAMELALSGRKIDAAEAFRLGLVHRVVPDAELAAATRRWALELLQAPPFALAQIKDLMHRGETSSLVSQLAEEQRCQLECFARPEVLERLRPPPPPGAPSSSPPGPPRPPAPAPVPRPS